MPNRYYSPEHIARLEVAQSFKEVGEIALNVLDCMPHGSHIIMVCGPITSGGKVDPAHNMKVLERAIEKLVRCGHFVFNQLPLEIATARLWHEWKRKNEMGYCWELLTDIYLPAFQSGRIRELRFLPNWESSTGTRWEHEQAEKHGIMRSYFSANWEDEVAIYV